MADSSIGSFDVNTPGRVLGRRMDDSSMLSDSTVSSAQSTRSSSRVPSSAAAMAAGRPPVAAHAGHRPGAAPVTVGGASPAQAGGSADRSVASSPGDWNSASQFLQGMNKAQAHPSRADMSPASQEKLKSGMKRVSCPLSATPRHARHVTVAPPPPPPPPLPPPHALRCAALRCAALRCAALR